jgi:hypothetical protein
MAVNFLAQSVEPLEKAQRRMVAEVMNTRGHSGLTGRGRGQRNGRGCRSQGRGG